MVQLILTLVDFLKESCSINANPSKMDKVVNKF